jgi:rhodanese-related sulfurtransferase
MTAPSFRTMTVDEVEPLLGDPNAVIVDVREPHELEATGKIPGALAVPLGQIPEALAPGSELRESLSGGDKTLVFYCAAGARSARAAGAAAEAGLGRIVNMQGGFNAWAQAALPVED